MKSARSLVVLFLGCASASHPSAREPPTREPEPLSEAAADEDDNSNDAIVRELLRTTERARELRFEHPVAFGVENEATIRQYLLRELDDPELEVARIVYTALGLLPPDLDIRDLLARVLGEQVVGYYDPEDKRLVVRDDVMRSLERRSGGGIDEARIVIVHELVHALQDQRLGLGEVLDADRDTDAENAFRALTEGDATLAMLGYIVQSMGGSLDAITARPSVLRAQLQNLPTISGTELEQAPAILRVTLLSAYLDGVVFAATLHGQQGWSAVDDAHRRAPESTEQILHPDRYLRRERPETVRMPELLGLARAGYALVDEDTMGELEMGVYFGQASAPGVNTRAAEGWGGDRLRVYRRGAEPPAAVWFSTWDTESEASEAEQAANAVAPAREGSEHLVVRSGRAILIVHALDPRHHPAIRNAFARFATSLPTSRP